MLIVGIGLSLFNANLGIGASLRIPLTESNLTVAGSIGVKEKARDALPDYDQGRLGANQNFFNNSWTLTIGPAEGAGLIVIGRQDMVSMFPPAKLAAFLKLKRELDPELLLQTNLYRRVMDGLVERGGAA